MPSSARLPLAFSPPVAQAGLARRALFVGLLLGLVLAFLPAASASASPRMCFYAQERNIAGGAATGHAFVQLLPDSGSQAGRRDLVYGFYPKIGWRFIIGSPGNVAEDKDHGWDWKLCKTVDQDKYNDAQKLVSDDIKNPPEYVFFRFNCTDWVYKVARKAGVTLPDPGALGTGVFDPEVMAKKLQAMFAQQGGRNIPGGNAVFHNSNKQKPVDSSDHRVRGALGAVASRELSPDSYIDITRLAFSDPHGLAKGLDLDSDTQDLPDASLEPDGRLRVSIDGIDPGKAITSVRWGDGTQEYQGARFDHRYRHAGSYHVTGISVARSTVYRFSFTVEVGPGGAGAFERTADMPDLDPRPDNRPKLERPVAPLPD